MKEVFEFVCKNGHSTYRLFDPDVVPDEVPCNDCGESARRVDLLEIPATDEEDGPVWVGV